jgi:orotate phosphoribosyltransferase
MNLFQTGEFTLHSGDTSTFKIDCDALTDEDLATVAQLLADRLRYPFGHAEGIPRGGTRLAEAMQAHATLGGTLLVDDVWTTGKTLYQAYRKIQEKHGHQWFMANSPLVQAAVIFSRNPTPRWCTPLFWMNPGKL